MTRLVLPQGLLKRGEVAEWSKAAALGAALFGGVGSNPILVSVLKKQWKMEPKLFSVT